MTTLFSACQEENIETYSLAESKVYFQEQGSSDLNGLARYGTTTSYSFVEVSPIMEDIVLRGRVQLMGQVVDYDRPIKVSIDKENTTFEQGEGFEINLDTLSIKAGTNTLKLGVRFFRTESLRTKNDTLTLKLEPNEHFSVLEKYKSNNDWKDDTATEIDGTRYTFIVGEVYTKPGSWNGGSPLYTTSYFGEWNITRYLYINEFFGFTINDWTYVNGATSKLTQGRMQYYARQLQKELQKRADEGNPVLDEDGSYMQLPGDYQVDYSSVVKK